MAEIKQESPINSVVVFVTELLKSSRFHLTDSLPGEIKQLADFFKCHSTTIGHIKCAGFCELPDFEIGKVEFDRACVGIYVQIQVVFAGNKGARTFAGAAICAVFGAEGVQIFKYRGDLKTFFVAEFFEGYGFASPQSLAGTALVGGSFSRLVFGHW